MSGDTINSVSSQQRVAAHVVGTAVDPPSLIDIKTGATMMRYAMATRGSACARVRGDGETTYNNPSAAQPADLPKTAAAA